MSSFKGPHVSWLEGTFPQGAQTLILTDAGKLALGIKSNDGTTIKIKEAENSSQKTPYEASSAETSEEPTTRKKVSEFCTYC